LPDSVIKEFVAGYAREFDYYEAASRLCHQQCEALLAARGVKAIVTHRAKKPTKLFTKLRQRDGEKNYRNSEQIREDVADLAGVRIALYFPDDLSRVGSIIQENFIIAKSKKFPEDGKKRAGKRFEGYYAHHFRVTIPDSTLNESQKNYADASIEIQVGSVLMHAWAEVEHDLVYKPESGSLSKDERAVLDELNGMVLAGEIALERLQAAVERRLIEKDVQFDSHYELAAFLYKWIRGFSLPSEPNMGRVDILWELLRKANLTSATKLAEILGSPIPTTEDQSISDQIADIVLNMHPELYDAYVFAACREACWWHSNIQQDSDDRATNWIVAASGDDHLPSAPDSKSACPRH
jgi:ppGpp synthetase/RelA/SpoT-type nucleotidyltranferase